MKKVKIANIILILLLLASLYINICSRGTAKTETATELYSVQQGDTLWSIALENKPKSMDTRKYIDLLYRENSGLTASIHPGQGINILVLED